MLRYTRHVRRKTAAPLDINSPEFMKRFRAATKRFNARATKSREAALAVLVKEGICTKTGKLTKNYR
jgi:hypothetical protein